MHDTNAAPQRALPATIAVVLLLATSLAGCVTEDTDELPVPDGFGDDGTGPVPGPTPPTPTGPGTTTTTTTTPANGPTVGDTVDRWENERDGRGSPGTAATFELEGTYLDARGNLSVEGITAPFVLAPAELFPAGTALLHVFNATVVGHGAGHLVVEGAHIDATAGTLGPLATEHVSTTPEGVQVALPQHRMDKPAEPDVDWPAAWEDANRSMFFTDYAKLAVQGVTLAGFDRAVLLTPDGPRPLDAPITVDAPGLAWDVGSRVIVQQLSVTAERVAIAGNVTTGSVTGDGVDVEDPLGIHARDGALELGAGRIASGPGLRVTQVLTDRGPAIPAGAEVLPTRTEITLAPGELQWVKVHVRETTGRGDAALSNVTVEGTATGLVSFPLEAPPLLIEEMFQLIAETGPAWPFFAIGLVPIAPFLVVFDAIGCILGGCPEQHPYPVWMDAGTVDVFYYQVDATDRTTGTYDAVITLEGHNYAPVELPVRVTVA